MRQLALLTIALTFALLVQLRVYAPDAISYPPTDNYSSDCGAGAFFTCHGVSNFPPTITDNQTGDDVWRNANSGTYNVDFADSVGLARFDTTVWTGTSQSGTQLQAWTQVSTLSGTSYTTNWALLATTWTAMQEGTNYVSVRVVDSGGLTTTRLDPFYVRKDTVAPANPSSIEDGTASDIDWVASTTSLSANWAGASDATSGVADYDWCFTTNATNDCGNSGRQAVGTNLAATTVTAAGLSLTQGTTYYFCIRARDAAGNVAAAYSCSDGQSPDTGAPTITDNQAGDTTWRTTNTATYDVDFADAWALGQFETRIWTGTGQGGTMLQDWTQVSTLTGTSYTTNWSLASSTWTALQQGTSYVTVRVTDAAGTSTMLEDAFFVQKDTVAPGNPGTVNDGSGADIATQTSSTTLEANWTAGSDATSGVADYEYCFATATACGGTVVASGTTAGTSVSRTSLTLSPWTTYYACVRTRDNAANTASGYACSDGVQVQGALTVSVAGWETAALGFMSPGDTSYVEARVTVSTDAPGGYTLTLHDPDGNGATWSGTASMDWNTSGSVAAPAAFSGTGVAISAFGGAETPDRWCSGGQANCTAIDDADLRWAQLTATAQAVSRASAPVAGDVTRLPVRATLPISQAPGSYSGQVVVTATPIP